MKYQTLYSLAVAKYFEENPDGQQPSENLSSITDMGKNNYRVVLKNNYDIVYDGIMNLEVINEVIS